MQAAARKPKRTSPNAWNRFVSEGADFIDIGAYSSRPNATDVSAAEEAGRLQPRTGHHPTHRPDAVVSVDTFRADIAAMCVEEYGVAVINDISGGQMDKAMFDTVARLNVPYIMMHMKGTPQDMQQHPHYDHLMKEVMQYFAERVQELHARGVTTLSLTRVRFRKDACTQL